MIGLIGYVLSRRRRRACSRIVGFADTLRSSAALNHGSGLVELASNPYAAMPSLHAADALIVGCILASVVRRRFKVLWLLWPAWVWFAVMATGNHFWLDVSRHRARGGARSAVRRSPSAGQERSSQTCYSSDSRNAMGQDMRDTAVLDRVKQGYTTAGADARVPSIAASHARASRPTR